MIQTSKLALFASAEALVNKLLHYDPKSQSQMEKIDDALILVEVTQPDIQLWLHFINNKVRIIGSWDGEIDASIKGHLSEFLALMKEEDKNQVLMSTKMEISGNTQTLTTMQLIASNLDIDWESAISDLVGDIPGHLVSGALKQGFNFASEIRRSVSHSWDNYWNYESDDLVKPEQYNDTASDISSIRFQSDRLEARINRLMSKSGKN